jgi:hypothetical protein
VLAKIRDELGPEAASALRRFNRAIERQAQESRFCGNEDDVIDVGPDGMTVDVKVLFFLIAA